MSLQTRQKQFFIISKILVRNFPKNSNVSLSDLEKQITVHDFAEGNWSKVYSNTYFIISVSRTKKMENELWNKYYNKSPTKLNLKHYPQESIINYIITKYILLENISPNFLYTYYVSIFKQKKEYKYLQVIEKGEKNFSYLDVNQDLEEQRGYLYQLLIAYYILNNYFGIVHQDVKGDNILLKKTPKKYIGKYFQFDIANDTFFTKCGSYYPVVIDFNVSYIGNPKYTYKDKSLLKPRILKYVEGNKKLVKGSFNIDEEDFITYPLEKFSLDIVNLLYMFLGGPKWHGKLNFQPGEHKGVRNLRKEFLSEISNALPQTEPNAQPIEAIYYNGHQMLKSIYAGPININSSDIIYTFQLKNQFN